MLYRTLDTPLGGMLLAATQDGLAGAWFDDQQHLPDVSGWTRVSTQPLLDDAAQQMLQYLRGERVRFDLVLAPAWGTAFQTAVWQALRQIPHGHTTSYGTLARTLHQPRAARAVGAAVGRNPWSVIVPCHRVLGAQGAMTGYAGGLARKQALLQLEGAMR